MAGGNYGGASIPTTPVSGADITGAAYEGYKCTSVYATVNGGAFTYNGVTFTFATQGQSMDLVINPGGISATDADLIFLCYPCSCSGPMSGTTEGGDPAEYYSGTTAMFRPVIIGAGGLNS